MKKSDRTNRERISEIIKAMGLVFGDIGTSPIYTMTVVFLVLPITVENVYGVLSLLFWTMVILVTIEYTFLAMSLNSNGEGGIIVLKEILHSYVKKGRKSIIIAYMGFIGVSFLIGDGVITPAISILSAVEGLKFIPNFSDIPTNQVIFVTIIITIVLFSIQSKGTDKVATSFGPIMVLWFGSLFIFGIISLFENPQILWAINPYEAIKFLSNNGFIGFIVLSEVILSATGGEALYADMGHLGKKPIVRAWYFVFIALIINYFGQGSFAILLSSEKETTSNILFGMVNHIQPYFYIPFLLITLLATIIASQAMISAIFSLIYQGIRTYIFPLLRVTYTSSKLKSQIYINSVNWAMLLAVIFIILLFRESANLAAAYGFAVTITMAMSTIFMIWIFKNQKSWIKFVTALAVFVVNLMFLFAVFTKIPHGGYWSIIIGIVPFIIIYIWSKGNKSVYKSFRPLSLDIYSLSFEQIYNTGKTLPGTALFFAKSLNMIPPYMVHSTIRSGIIYENNVLVSVATTETSRGIEYKMTPNLAKGLSGLEIKFGYMERVDVPKILKECNIEPKVMFYGVDDIKANQPLLKIYSIIKRLTPNFVQFMELPYQKLHGVYTRIEI